MDTYLIPQYTVYIYGIERGGMVVWAQYVIVASLLVNGLYLPSRDGVVWGHYIYIYIYIYIHIHVFRPFQDLSVWLGLTSREQLMSPECSKHQVLSFARMLVVWWTNKKTFALIHQCSPECSMNKFRAYIYIYTYIYRYKYIYIYIHIYIYTDMCTCFALPRTHQCGSG